MGIRGFGERHPRLAAAAAAAAGAAALGALAARGYSLPASPVKLRGIFWALNWACDAAGQLQRLDATALEALHERVLDAERAAYGDDAAADAAKRSLFDVQLEGVDAPGNRFTPLGRVLFAKDLALRLRRRLRDAALVAKTPPKKALAAPPVVIAGLPRTGSTLLHRLLAVDARFRSPLYWEVAHDDADGAPAADAATDARADAVANGFAKLAALSPNGLAEFQKFHAVDARAVEEVTPLLRRYFWDTETALLAPSAVSKRLQWLASDAVDRRFVVRHLAAWLAAHDDGRRRWLLKSPLLTAFLPEVAAVFPTAPIVFTSRDPARVAPSLCGLNAVACSLKFRGADLRPHGAAVLGRLAGYADAQAAHVAAGRAATLVAYDDLVDDPLAAADRVYAAAGLAADPAVKAAMVDHLDANRRHKHGAPAYDLAAFGLDAAAIAKRFAAYAAFHHARKDA